MKRLVCVSACAGDCVCVSRVEMRVLGLTFLPKGVDSREATRQGYGKSINRESSPAE